MIHEAMPKKIPQLALGMTGTVDSQNQIMYTPFMTKDFTYDTFSPRKGVTIAYRQYAGDPVLPGVVFCGGYRSDMQGTKASFLEETCRVRGQSFVRFDYTGHGVSSGDFEDGTIGAWLQDTLDVFDNFTTGPQIVIGSSMGGWIMLLLALKRKARLHGLIGIAPAPDFSEDIYYREMNDADRAELEEKGVLYRPSPYGAPYAFTKNLIVEARQHLLLTGPLDIACPVRLIHGKQDDSVPWQKSEKIRDCLVSGDVKIFFVEDGDHSLSRKEDLARLDQVVQEFNNRYRPPGMPAQR